MDWRYGFQDTSKNVISPALKSGLRHLPFYFWNIMIFCVDWMYGCQDTRKTYINRLWIRVYSICRSIFRTFKIILCWLELRLPRYVRNHLFPGFEIRIFVIHLSIFKTLEVVLCRLELRLPRYEGKCLFVTFDIMFTVLEILILVHLRLFFMDWMYSFQDTGTKSFCRLWNLVWHLPFYFWNIGGNFALIECMVAKIRGKHILIGFEFGFTAFAVLFLEHWRLFWVDWSYGCQDTRETIYFPVLKSGIL